MELFSLEDDDFGDMFITQSSSVTNVVENCDNSAMDVDESVFLGVNATDLSLLVRSLLDKNVKSNDYSDISDFEETDQNSTTNVPETR